MAVFTSNQVNHVYIAKTSAKDAVSGLALAGDIFVGKTLENELYFVYKNAEGKEIRSDLIPIKNIMWAKAIGGLHKSQQRKLKKYTITLPTVEKDKTYSVAIEVNLHNGVESIYRKTASVVARVNSETASVITARLAETLQKSVERDDYVNDKIKVLYTSGGTSISIVELPQSSKYKVGLFANEGVDFKVFSDDAYINYYSSAAHPLEVLDATNADITGDTTATANNAYVIGNSYDIADLEYFALGERGDKYRLIGWPNAAPSKTLATFSDDTVYNILNIHFAFTDSNEGVQKSEKDITIAVAESGVTKINSILNKIATLVNNGTSSEAFKLAAYGGVDANSDGDYADDGDTPQTVAQATINILDIPNLSIIKTLE